MWLENALKSAKTKKTMTIFTVFTPSYNRGRTLHRVYESLQHQTFRDFE
jgi:glycosyltransferase involved in cell wall biosynthesis